jgi:predicted metal-dependent hydrolase
MWSTSRSEAALEEALPAPIQIRQLKSARRLRLRFDEATGTLKLTCPWRTSRRAALVWALDQREWIAAQLARSGPAEPFAPGATIPLEGEEVRIAWDAAWPRTEFV